ncbi:MAG: AAA family ATPase [Nannocystis sp.]|nr:AAA family ATPase [Nannocystis sp.]
MRIDRLSVERFGRFGRLDLDLGPGLNVLHGPNEAGKSTLLEAIRSLFFGIDERTPYAFRFSYHDIALRADLQDSSGQHLEITRKKRRKGALTGTLRSEAGAVEIDEARFAGYFAGVSEHLYGAIFGFDLADLQRGAAVLEVAGLGELLGGASLGGSGEAIRRAVAELQGEAEGLFKARGKNPAINRTLELLRDARERLRDATLQQGQYQGLEQRRSGTCEALEAAERAQRQASARLDRVRRLAAAADDFAEQQAVAAGLAAPANQSPLTSAEAGRARALVAEVEAQARAVAALEEERVRLVTRAAGLADDPGLRAEGGAIEGLLRRVDAIARLRREVPAERAAVLLERSRLAAEAGALGLETEGAGDGAVDPAAAGGAGEADRAALRERLRAAVERWRGAREKVSLASGTARREAAELAAAAAAAAAAGERAEEAGAAALLLEVEAAAGQRAEMEAAALEARGFAAEVEALLAGVEPRPAPEGLAALRLPSAEALMASSQASATAAQASLMMAAEEERVTAALSQVSAEIEALTAARALPSGEALAAARAAREAAFEALEGRLRERVAISEIERYGLLRGLAAAIVEADALADRLLAEADAVVATRTLEARAAELRARAAALKGEKEAAARAAAAAMASAEALWAPCGLAPPREAGLWLRAVSRAQDLARAQQLREARVAELRPRLAALEARARGLLGGTGLSWAGMVRGLRELERAQEGRRVREAAAKERAAALTAATALAKAGLAAAQAEESRLAAEVAALLPAFGLPGELDPLAALHQVERRREYDARAAALRERERALAGREAELRGFDEEAAALLGRLQVNALGRAPESVIEVLGGRWRGLEAAAVAREHALAAAAAKEADSAAAAASLAARREALRALFESVKGRSASGDGAAGSGGDAPGWSSRDDAAPGDAAGGGSGAAGEEAGSAAWHAVVATLTRWAAAAGAREELEGRAVALERRLARTLGGGEGRRVDEEELRQGTGSQWREEEAALRRELERSDQQRAGLAVQKGKLDQELESLGSDRAARVSAEMESLVAELTEQVDRYVQVHVAQRILERVTERHAREHQSAILGYASELCGAITGGRYVRVVPEPEGKTLALVDVNGEARAPAALSTGTREQLFLALRLAYVLDYCDRAEPLPVVMDDVLVNFDAARAQATLEALRRVAGSTQVLLFTCHRHLVEMAAQVAPEAPILEIPGGL